MARNNHSDSPTILLRISDESFHMHRSFNDFTQAIRTRRGLCRSRFQRRDDLGDGAVFNGIRATRAKASCLKLANWLVEPYSPFHSNSGENHAFLRKKPRKWGRNRGFHLILLDVFGIIVEYDHQETR